VLYPPHSGVDPERIRADELSLIVASMVKRRRIFSQLAYGSGTAVGQGRLRFRARRTRLKPDKSC
jgi:hypothetical protein